MSSSAIDINTPHTGTPADVIPLQYHAQMLVDEHRTGSFEEAIAAVVRPGMHVLDLGTGTGIMAFFAARNGARVTAVEREPIVLAAARSALESAVGDAVQLVHADARDYLPSEPIDLVICEMMHTGQLRERQIEVIGAFKQNYRATVGGPLPRFLPEACIQAVQPVQQDFTFHGYTVPAPLFQHAFSAQDRTLDLAPPKVFQQFFYDERLPETCTADLEFVADQRGWLNAIRIVTKNILIAQPNPPGSVEWLMGYLVVPLAEPKFVEGGQQVRIRFSYRPGDEIDVLARSAQAFVMGADRMASRRLLTGTKADLRATGWSLAAMEAMARIAPHQEPAMAAEQPAVEPAA